MPCEPFLDKDGKVIGWICSRSRVKPKPQLCYKCGKPATRLCDFRDFRGAAASIHTCDCPMCAECANNAGHDHDFCDEHFNEFDLEKKP